LNKNKRSLTDFSKQSWFSKNLTAKKNTALTFAALFCIYFWGCAHQVAPTGGPLDKTPPQIVQTWPENNSINVSRDEVIEIQFSERMNQKSLEKALFITPDPGQRLKTKWSGKRLRLLMGGRLDSARTYVITLGVDLKDAHGNSLPQVHTLAFSTGDKISNGKISGRIYGADKLQGALLWAYILDQAKAPNPQDDPGDYVTQSDAAGKYQFSHLSPGNYRIFAIEDKDNNRFFEYGSDGLGVPANDVSVANDSALVSGLNFRIHVSDTIGPALSETQVENNTHIRLLFDEALDDSTTNSSSSYQLSLQKNKQPITITNAYVSAVDSNEVNLITEKHTVAEYIVSANDVRDLAGNLVDKEFNSDSFTGSAKPDTLGPRLLKYSPGDSARSVPFHSKINMHFNEPLRKALFERMFLLLDSLERKVDGSFSWSTPASVVFNPDSALMSLGHYQVSIQMDSVQDLVGNHISDSTFSWRFTTINIDTLTSIAGNISDQDSTADGSIYLTAILKNTQKVEYKTKIAAPGSYLFDAILPGSYRIEGFRDSDGNRVYSYGAAFPFVPAERFIVYDDSVRARARWPNEGNDISFTK